MKYGNETAAMQTCEEKIATPDNLAAMMREDRMMAEDLLGMVKRVNCYLFGPEPDENGCEPETECFRDEVMKTGFALKDAIGILTRVCDKLGA